MVMASIYRYASCPQQPGPNLGENLLCVFLSLSFVFLFIRLFVLALTWQCSELTPEGLTLAGGSGDYGMLEVEHGLVACQTNTFLLNSLFCPILQFVTCIFQLSKFSDFC